MKHGKTDASASGWGKRPGTTRSRPRSSYIVGQGLSSASEGKGWEVVKQYHPPIRNGDWWVFRCDLTFEKTSGRRGTETEYRQWEDIKAMIIQTGRAAKFGEYPWDVLEPNATTPLPLPPSPAIKNMGGAPSAPADDGVIPDGDGSLSGVLGELNSKIIT